MKSNFASGVVSALIYCQALLVFAGVAFVVTRDLRIPGPFLQSGQAQHQSVSSVPS